VEQSSTTISSFEALRQCVQHRFENLADVFPVVVDRHDDREEFKQAHPLKGFINNNITQDQMTDGMLSCVDWMEELSFPEDYMIIK